MKKVLSFILSVIILFAAVPAAVGAEGAVSLPVITLNKVWGNPGSTVDINISIDNNPGIMAMAFCVTYDSDALEYVSYREGYLTNYNIKDHSDKGYVSFVSAESEDINTNGTMLTLSFEVKTTAAEGDYKISIVNNNPDTYADSLHNSFANSKEQFIVPVVYSGTITVSGEPIFQMGDINGDSSVNNKDLGLLMQHLNGWNVEILTFAADVNADGSINNKDYGLLMQYLNGWDVKLGTKTADTDNDDDNDGIPDDKDDDDNGNGIPDDEENHGNQGPLVFFLKNTCNFKSVVI